MTVKRLLLLLAFFVPFTAKPTVAQTPKMDVVSPRAAEGIASITAEPDGNIRVTNNSSVWLLVEIIDRTTKNTLVHLEPGIKGIGDVISPGGSIIYDQPKGRNAIVNVMTPGPARQALTTPQASAEEFLRLLTMIDATEQFLSEMIGMAFTVPGGFKRGELISSIVRLIARTPKVLYQLEEALERGVGDFLLMGVSLLIDDILLGGPLLATVLGLPWVKAASKKLINWLVARGAIASVPVAGEIILGIEIIYNVVSAAKTLYDVNAIYVTATTTPARLQFFVSFQPAVYEVFPETVRRSGNSQEIKILGALLLPQTVNGRPVQPRVTFTAKDRNGDPLVQDDTTLRFTKHGTRLRAWVRGDFLRRAKSPMTMAVHLGDQALDRRPIQITKGQLEIDSITPSRAEPGQAVRILGQGMPTTAEPLTAVFRSKKKRSIRVPAHASVRPLENVANVLVPVGLGHRTENEWTVSLETRDGARSNELDFTELKTPRLFDHPANGSFERAQITPQDSITLRQGSRAIDAWLVGSGSIEYVRAPRWEASEEVSSVDLNGTGAGSLQTTLYGLASVTRYELSFDLAGNPDCKDKSVEVEVSVGGNVRSWSAKHGDRTSHAPRWERKYFVFTSAGRELPLVFESKTSGTCGPLVDNVTVVPFREVDLNGRWLGTGYQCGDVDDGTNEVEIRHLPLKSVTARMVAGDACVHEDEVSWEARLRKRLNDGPGERFKGELQVGLKRWKKVNAVVHSRDHISLEVKKGILGRKVRTMHFYRIKPVSDNAMSCLEKPRWRKGTFQPFSQTYTGTLKAGQVWEKEFTIQPHTLLQAEFVKRGEGLEMKFLERYPPAEDGWRGVSPTTTWRVHGRAEGTPVVHKLQVIAEKHIAPADYEVRVRLHDVGDAGLHLEAGKALDARLELPLNRDVTGHLFSDVGDYYRIPNLPALSRVRVNILSVDDGRGPKQGRNQEISVLVVGADCKNGRRTDYGGYGFHESVSMKSSDDPKVAELITSRPGHVYVRVVWEYGQYHRYRLRAELLDPIEVRDGDRVVGWIGEHDGMWYAKTPGTHYGSKRNLTREAAEKYLRGQ